MVWHLFVVGADPPVDTGGVAGWVVLLLGGGGAASVYTLVKAYRLWASGVETAEAAAIANLERWRLDADQRADAAEDRAESCIQALARERELTAWQDRRIAHLERTLVIGGIEPPPPETPRPRPSP